MCNTVLYGVTPRLGFDSSRGILFIARNECKTENMSDIN